MIASALVDVDIHRDRSKRRFELLDVLRRLIACPLKINSVVASCLGSDDACPGGAVWSSLLLRFRACSDNEGRKFGDSVVQTVRYRIDARHVRIVGRLRRKLATYLNKALADKETSRKSRFDSRAWCVFQGIRQRQQLAFRDG